MNDFVTSDEFDDDIKNSYMKNYAQIIVDEFLIYKKHLNLKEFSYEHIVNGSNEEMNLSEDEFKEVISLSKTILQTEYGIEIISDNPIEIKEVTNQ